MKTETEVIRRVHVPGEQVCLEIGEFGDAPEALEIRTSDAKSKEWFGPVQITMMPEYALEFGKALVAAANEKLSKKVV